MILTDPPPIRELEENLAYTFKDPSILETALTLPSYRVENNDECEDNQRLEFLGDAVLGLVSAQLLYDAHPDLDEGRLTNLRSQMASGRALAAIAREINLGAHFLIGRGEERQGGRDRIGALADALEAVFGAIWLDGGIEAVRATVLCLIGIPSLEGGPDEWAENPKGELQEYVQQNGLPLPEYEVVETGGKVHEPRFRMRVRCNGFEAEAEGTSKRLAERLAAAQMLELLSEEWEEGDEGEEEEKGDLTT